jgi:hypothetical protein
MDENLNGGLKQEFLFRLYPGIKAKVIGEDEVTEEDIAEWKASRKARREEQERAEKEAAEKAARGDDPPAEEEEAEEAE